MNKLLYLVLALGPLGKTAAAQIAPVSAAQQRAANRQALREASRTQSPYKESHLTVTPEQLKRGNTAGPPGTASPAAQPTSTRPRKGFPLLRGFHTEPAP